MKRIHCLLLLLLSGVGAWAQVAPAGRAQVVAVTVESFSVPQVRLPNAAVARRINQQLRRLLVTAYAEATMVDSTASLLRQLRQQYRGCCYDAVTKHWMVGQGFTGMEYEVLLNQHSLLSLSATVEFTGAHHDYQTTYLTFDLQTGRLLTLPDVLAEPFPRLRRRLQGAINRRYQERALEVKNTYSAPRDTAQQHEYLRLLSWDEATQHVQLGWSAEDTPGEPALQEFALTPQALVIFYQYVGFNYWSQGEEPDNAYHFPYRSLQVRPLLAWAQAAKPRPTVNARRPQTKKPGSKQ